MVIHRRYENREHKKQLKISEQEYKSLFEFNKDAVYSMDLNGIFKRVNRAALELSGYSQAETMKMTFKDMVLPADLVKAKRVFELTLKGEPQTTDIRIIQKSGKIIHINMRSVPIVLDNQVVGVYGISSDVTEKKETEKMIEHLAYHDYLTGLPNRNMLGEYLSKELVEATRNNSKVAILFIDLDRFKVVNDTLGHSVGDHLLIEVAKRLKDSVLDADMIFRQGGDEFIVILQDADREISANVATRILENLTEHFTIENYDIYTTPSIGISLFPKDGDGVETLIKQADFAMYQAKKSGKNTYRFYSVDDDKQLINPLKMEMELHKGIERNEFALHYQPKVNLKTGRVVGAEALIRWNHPDLGMVPPGDFIPMAEETGLILPIGEWALTQACYQNKQWIDSGYPPIVISVNLSARQFSQSDLVKTVGVVLEKTGLEPRYLELEITESLTSDIGHTISILQQLKKLGVLISIDDFGTGFTSLNYLKQFQIDTLKIDRSFVAGLPNNLDDQTIVKTIISMAHNLQLSVVAEGIETREQLIFLQQHLCEEGQGYFFSEPLPAGELEKELVDIEKMVRKFGLPQDINQQKWLEESVRMARKELQDTIRQQQGMTFKFKKIDERFIHTLCDGELLYRLGLIPEQVVGNDLFDFNPEEIAIEQTKYYQKAWDGDEYVTYEAKTNGVYYFTALKPVKRGGKIIEVIGSCVDITTLKKMEHALRESQRMYSLIANNTTDLITIFDLKGEIVYASPSHESILGYPPSHYEGVVTIEPSHTDYDAIEAEVFQDTIRNKEIRQLEVRLHKREGGWGLFDSVLTPIVDESGSVIHVVGVARDITEKKKAEELLLKSEKLSVVGELAAGVAHEIRNPITTIKGFVQLFQQGSTKPEYFDIVSEEFIRLEEIIGDFLGLAKPKEINLKKSNAQDLLTYLKKLIISETNRNNIQFTIDIEAGLPEIMCDLNQMKQVFINLVKNSIEALPTGGGVVKVTATVDRSSVLFSVSDNGVGISPERIERLGEPFYSNKEKGTGLGLMVSYRIVKEHQGTITIKSELNKGTTVEVRLPAVKSTGRKKGSISDKNVSVF